MLKRIINISFLALIVFQAIGLISYLTISQSIAKHQAKEIIESKSIKLEELRIPLSEIGTIKLEGKEFEYKGELYDLKKFTLTKTHIVLHVFNDKKEKEIKENIALLFSKKNKSGGENTIAKLLNLKYTSTNFQLHLKQVCTQKNNYANYNTIFSNSIVGTTTPPPKI